MVQVRVSHSSKIKSALTVKSRPRNLLSSALRIKILNIQIKNPSVHGLMFRASLNLKLPKRVLGLQSAKHRVFLEQATN